jgi:hypothetical protein
MVLIFVVIIPVVCQVWSQSHVRLLPILPQKNDNDLKRFTPCGKNRFLSLRSNRTPKQLLKKNADDNNYQKLRKKAYGWAMDHLIYSEERHMLLKGEKDKISLATITQMATDRFHLKFSSSTLSSLKAKGGSSVQQQGSPEIVSEIELTDLAEAVLLFIAILSQINGDPEVQAKAAMAVLHKIYGEKKMPGSFRFLWDCIKRKFSHMIDLDKEMLVELRHPMWTTYDNLNDWFIVGWKDFCLQYEFFIKDGPPEGFEGEIYFSEEQRRWILNLDETFLTLDGSDGRKEGHPPSSIVVKGVS